MKRLSSLTIRNLKMVNKGEGWKWLYAVSESETLARSSAFEDFKKCEVKYEV